MYIILFSFLFVKSKIKIILKYIMLVSVLAFDNWILINDIKQKEAVPAL